MPIGRRILVVAPQPFYSDRGTPIATRHLLEALSELGYEIDVLTYPLGRSLDIPGVRLIRIPNPTRIRSVPIGFSIRKCWLDLFFFAGIARCLRENTYTCVSALEEAAFVAALVAPRFGVPVIYDMQCSLAEQMAHVPPFGTTIGTSFLNRCEQWLLDQVDLTMTSAGLAERVRRASPEARVHEWRYPGITERVSERDVGQLRKELALNGAGPVILYSGSFKNYQGVTELLSAFPAVLESVPTAILLLVGAEDGADDDHVRRLSRHMPAASLRVLERQPHESMPGFLALADVVVSPRLYGENLPIKVLEYLACGQAIVATSIPAHRTVLDDDRAVLVEPRASALASGITSLLKDDERRAELKRNARAFAEKQLDWLGFVHSVGEAFREVCGDERPR